MHEFILGGQRSGKSRCGESRAADWLARPGHRAVLLATALRVTLMVAGLEMAVTR
jgi:adenosylcobinamide kinase/adenosylcobinamide-phosphate guanylyltransferase